MSVPVSRIPYFFYYQVPVSSTLVIRGDKQAGRSDIDGSRMVTQKTAKIFGPTHIETNGNLVNRQIIWVFISSMTFGRIFNLLNLRHFQFESLQM